jgi:hypothetical protein
LSFSSGGEFEMIDRRFEYIRNQILDEMIMEQQKSRILMEQQKSNNEKIQQLKEDIAINKEKLQKLEELQRTKSPAEEAFKKVFRYYPYEKDFREGIWFGFEKGYNASQEPEKWDVVRESVKWCEEHPDESVEDYLKPHTPEKTEQLLREAFQKVQQTEEWKETQRKIDSNYEKKVEEEPKPMNEVLDRLENKYKDAEENAASYMTDEVVNRMLKKWEENPPNFLKFELGQSLTDLIYDWWEDVFTKNSNDDTENCIGRLVYWIEEWLPKEQSAAGSQNVDTELLVDGFNDCLTKIKSKLRNKK